MPKVSIIVPVYKAEKYLPQCVDSILSQTFSDWECILVDDGSPDCSGVICDEYAQTDARIRVIHKENGGVSSARNAGLEEACGEWICFVDSDDTIQPSYLDDFEIDSTEVDLYMQGYVRVNGDKIISTHDFAGCKKTDFFSVLAYSEDNHIVNSPWIKLFKRSIIVDNNVLFDTNTSYGEDHLFSLSYILHCKSIHYSLGHGYMYHLHETESLTQRIVPFREIMYYTLKAKKYQDQIAKESKGDDYLASVGLCFMRNYISILTYLCKANGGYDDFKMVIDRCSPYLNSISTSKCSAKLKIFKKISLYPVSYILYFSMTKVLKIIYR